MRQQNKFHYSSERMHSIEKGGDDSPIFQELWGSPTNNQEEFSSNRQERISTTIFRQKTRRHSDSLLNTNLAENKQNKQYEEQMDFEYIKSKWFEAGADAKQKANLFKKVIFEKKNK
jgi:hypothetical protein